MFRKSLQPVGLGVLAVLLFASCGSLERPLLKEIQNLNMVKSNRNVMQLEAEAVFYNPNSKDLKLTRSELSISVNQRLVAIVKQQEKIRIEADSDFRIPLRATVSVDNFTDLALKNMESILSGKSLLVEITGELAVKRFGYSQTIPVKHSLEVNPSFFSPF